MKILISGFFLLFINSLSFDVLSIERFGTRYPDRRERLFDRYDDSDNKTKLKYYKVEYTYKNKFIFIDGLLFKPKLSCDNFIRKGDIVYFYSGKINDMCISDTIIKVNTNEKCEVWCD